MEKMRKNEMGWIYLGLLFTLFLLVYILWNKYHFEIVTKSTYYSYHIVNRLTFLEFFKELKKEAAFLYKNAGQVTFSQLISHLNKISYLFVIIPVLLTLNALRRATKHPANYSQRKINIQNLPHIIAHHSPAIIPSLYYGDEETLLLNVDSEEHKSALTPEEWAVKHQLVINGFLDIERCKKCFVEDLGKKINSIDELTHVEKVFFAIFATRIFGEKTELKQAQELLDALNRSCHFNSWQGKRGYPDLTLTNKVYKKFSNHPKIGEWIEKHSYSRTLLHAMHKQALKVGKLPSSHFRWLKGMDRGLFYALNTTGRKTPFVESAAVFTQTLWEEFVFERNIKLEEPAIEDAVMGLQNYLKKISFIT